MNKLELINTFKNEARVTKAEAAAVVNLFFDEMSKALADGDSAFKWTVFHLVSGANHLLTP